MAKRLKALILLATLLAGCASPITSRIPATSSTLGRISKDRIIVKIKSGYTYRSLDPRLHTVRSLSNLGIVILKAPSEKDAGELAVTLMRDSSVEWAEPDYSCNSELRLNDPEATKQYGNEKLDLAGAWDITMGQGVTVAVVDTGVDLSHPDLRDRVTEGVSFVEGATNPMDDNGHGTHVAGIIGATANNGIGIEGVAPSCRIMPVKVLRKDRVGRLSDIISGIAWAVDHGADVVNLSLGSDEDKNGYSKSMEVAVKYALSKNVAVVAAMGNMGINGQSYPAAYSGVIAVGATDENDEHASFSSYGKWISVTAPGVGIYSTTPTYEVFETGQTGMSPNYDYLDGTSMATPYVAGVVALILSRYPRLTPSGVKSRLERTADHLGVPGFNNFYGYGRVNAAKAVTE